MRWILALAAGLWENIAPKLRALLILAILLTLMAVCNRLPEPM